MHQSIPPAPIPPPPPRADPRALAFFLPWMANSREWGLLSCRIPQGGDEKRGQMPRSSSTLQPFCLSAFFCKCPTPGTDMAGKCPAVALGGGGGLLAGGIDWCITEQHILTTTDQSFPYQKAIKAYAYVITRRQYLINNFNLFSDFIFSDNGC